MLVDGVRRGKWDSVDSGNLDTGAFRRKTSAFRGEVATAAPGRYHL